MSMHLERSDKRLLAGFLLVFVILVTATILLTPSGYKDVGVVPSSYSAGSSGTKAAYLLLKELDYDAQRWTLPTTELPQPGRGYVYILADPTVALSAGDKTALRYFVRTGGRVLATGMKSSAWLESGLPRWDDPDPFTWHRVPPLAVSPISSGIPSIYIRPGEQWKDPGVDAVTVFGNRGGAFVLTRTIGEGRVVWWSNASPMTNRGLGQEKANLNLFLNSLQLQPETRILWDEYYHGHANTLAGYVTRTPLIWGLAQAALLFILIWMTFGRRHGPVLALPSKTRLSPLEFADAMGDLYHGAHAAAGAVGAAYERFRLLAGRKLGLPATSTPAEVAQAAVRVTGYQDAELYQTLSQCERAATVPIAERDALSLIQRLQEYSGTLGLLPQTSREETDV